MSLYIPGKTFLVGEYAVLIGGEALGIASKPYFNNHLAHSTNNLHPLSAAGLYLSKNNKPLINQLINTYNVGGFGYSTAEFISAWLSVNTDINYSEIFTEYRSLFDSNNQIVKIKPSGADLAFQVLGHITHFKQNILNSDCLDWNFKDLGFIIISTGLKILTHDHLESLDLSKLDNLPDLSNQVIQAYKSNDEKFFLESLKKWSSELMQKKLQHNNSLELISKLESFSAIKQAKPNGALGADTITIFYNIDDKITVLQIVKDLKLNFITDDTQIASGANYVD